jgi:hypothetical protein
MSCSSAEKIFMAFSVGASISAATVIGSGVVNALSRELDVPWLGRIAGIILPILGFGELAFSAAANAYPFLAIAGVVCGLMIGVLAILALSYVSLAASLYRR